MSCIIVYRVDNGSVEFVANTLGALAVFPHRDAAIAYCENNKLFQSGQASFQIVELDEL